MCFYFKKDFGAQDFDSAQFACESKFPYGSGQLFEPKSLSHLQQVKDKMTERSMLNNVYLGIDDSANEGSYVYSSDGSPLVSDIESLIFVTNGCGSKNCDHLYLSSGNMLITIWGTYNFVNLVCENVIPEGTFCILVFLFYN